MFFLTLILVPGPAGVALPGNAPCGTSLWRLFSGIHASAHSRKGNPRRTSDLVLGVQTPHHLSSETVNFPFPRKRNQRHRPGLAGLKPNGGAGGHVQSEAAGFGAVEIQSRVGFGEVVVGADLYRAVAGVGDVQLDAFAAGAEFDVAVFELVFTGDHVSAP